MLCSSSMAAAPLMVAAVSASSGVIFICVQASAITNAILPDGEEPGLKSDARTSGNPASMMLLAGV